MKYTWVKLLSCLMAAGIISSAQALTIIPTFDTSITSDPNVVPITNAIYAAIAVFQAKIADNQTVKIKFVSSTNVSLGQSLTSGSVYSYAAYMSFLRSHATSVNDSNALSKIPNTTSDPLVGGTNIFLNLPLAVLAGLDSGFGDDGFDSTITVNMPLMNLTRPPQDPGKYDLTQVLEHEIDEVLGSPSNLPDQTTIAPIDLFRYTTNLARTYTTNGDNAYFSVDGTNLVARFNMDSGGDYADWWSVFYPSNWSPILGVTTINPQVQDAFSGPGNALDLGPAELAMEDVIGWTLTTQTVTPPKLNIVRIAANQFTLSWTSTASFTLQESTNLLSATNWVASASGTTNPALITSAGTKKFYRLVHSANSPNVLNSLAMVAPSHRPAGGYQIKTHVTNPYPH